MYFPRCGSLNYRKDDFVNSLQRYECKDCRHHYTVSKKSDVKSAETRHKMWVQKTTVESGLPLTDLESGLSRLSAEIVLPKQDSSFEK
ncbi:hypothetical protein EZS27_017145 [termite gut metagenome]|uniref:InsA N-terminal domain-containing protein n=1 Tax=termite gut metagenome TaxID=433724 RepID=A0A5J4RN50_9ZZZZ